MINEISSKMNGNALQNGDFVYYSAGSIQFRRRYLKHKQKR